MLFVRVVDKCVKAFWMVLRAIPVCVKYCLYVLSSHKLYGEFIHEFSQLLVFSLRLRHVQGQTSASERAYFQWYAQTIYAGIGDIVDLGCGMGSTSIPLAIGLSKNANPMTVARRLHAFDNFLWIEYMDGIVAGTSLQGRYQIGESFLPEFNARIAPWKERVIVHQGDLLKMRWDGGVIEFLLIDSMKSWDLTNSIIGQFFPALQPGRSFILHQDFAHWFTPWIHLTQYTLRAYFEFVYEVPMSSSVVFKLNKSIPPDLLRTTFSAGSFTTEDIEAAFQYSFSLVSEGKHPALAAAKVMAFLNSGELERAKCELKECHAAGYMFDADLAYAEKRVLMEERARQ